MKKTLRLPSELRGRIEKAARILGTSAQDFIVQAVETALDRIRLSEGKQLVNLTAKLQTRRVRVSQGGREGQHDPLVLAANTAHHTLRSLAEAVECSAAALSRARHGTLSIPLARAKRIEEITGFRATPANWPRLVDNEEKKGRKKHGREPTKKPRPKKGAR
jgi:hypothetical protein